MNLAGKSSNPIAARKAKPVKRERRHVRTAVTAYVQLHTKANSAARGEVLEVLGQAAQNAASPAILAMRKTHVSKVVPRVLLSITPLPPEVYAKDAFSASLALHFSSTIPKHQINPLVFLKIDEPSPCGGAA